MTPRRIALNLICDWDLNATYPNLALKKALSEVGEMRDRSFISAIVYGVVEKKITLDHFLNQCANRKMDSLTSEVRSALRMGVYQMFYMNVPPSAACNTTVELIKSGKTPRASGFVNAVLRRCAQEKDTLILLKKADYSVRFSIHPKIVDLLLEQYGKEDFLKIIEGISQENNAIHLYHNYALVDEKEFIASLREDQIEIQKTDIPHLFKAELGFSVGESSAFKKGYFHVVGYHSAQAAGMVRNNDRNVLDLCAAPGGKTFILSANKKRSVAAFDLHPHKISLMQESANRLKRENVALKCADASVFDPSLENCADFVLCDVPCSGLGIMGKKPDIKYKEYISSAFTDLQYTILNNASKYLKVGGRLVYSTCTIDRRENDLQIQKFLKNHPEFIADDSAINNGMQTYLPQNGEDGFFIAVLRKESF